MPCNCDGFPASEPAELGTLRETKKVLDATLKDTEAVACALINQLKREKLEDLITRAEVNGKIDINGWYDSHKCQDEKRLNGILDKLSIDEVDLLKEMLNKK